MQIWFIRHGMTKGNQEKRYIGKTDEEILPKESIALKEKQGQLKEWLTDFSRSEVTLFISPAKRCRQTAELLFPEFIPVVAERLRECDFGAFEYKNYQELKGNAAYQKWIDSNGELPFLGGESQKSFRQRCVDCFIELVRQEREKKLLIFVVHNGTIMSLMSWFAIPKKGYFEWQVANGCGFVCEYLEEFDNDLEDNKGSTCKEYRDYNRGKDSKKFSQNVINKGGLLVCRSI